MADKYASIAFTETFNVVALRATIHSRMARARDIIGTPRRFRRDCKRSAFLASDDSSFATGSELFGDGGSAPI
jgi:hypothetical protein